jgi:hypothetical protein
MSRNSWKKREFVLLNTIGVSEVDFEIINFAPGGGGNDFVIDDIEIRRVLPDITYDQRCLETNFSGTLQGTVNSTAIPSTFDWYQWQQSNDGGDTWINLSAPAQAVAPLDPNNYTVNLLIPAPGAALGTKFRLIAATTEANLANAALIAGLAVVTVDDCCVTYRTSASNTGVWNLNTNWEIFDPSGSAVTFTVAPTPPVTGSRVEVRTPTVMNVDFTVENCPLVLNNNETSSLVIDAQRTLRFGGGEDGNAYFNSRPVTVRSNATGTGAIGPMDTDTRTFGDDNVTLERYIPGSKRRWNLLTFGVTNPTATIRDAWVGDALPISGSKNFNDGWPRGTPPPGMLTPMPAPPVSAPPVPGPPPNSFLNKPANVPFPTPGDYVAGNGTIITGHAHTSATSANPQGFDWWQELIIPANTPTWIYREILGDYVTRRSTTVVPTPSSIRPYRAGEASVWPPNRGTSWLSSETTINTNYLGLGKSIVNATLNEVEQGYMLFTRGDRNVLENWFNETTLRPNGQIRKFGEPTVTVSAPGTLTVVGNPYPSPIDFGEFHGLGSNGSKIERFFYFWDSNLGGTYTHGAWRTVTEASPGTWVAAPSTVGNRPELISSSSAFMVQTSTTGSGNLDFAENIKANITSVNVLPFEAGSGLGSGVFNIDFGRMDADNKLQIMDGAAILFGNYSTATTDKNDVGKIYGIVSSNEHISIKRDDKIFSFEAYPYPDTEARFPLEILNLNANTKYGFNLIANGIPPRYEAFVVDHHLKEEKKIDFVGSGFEFAFETKADSASFDADRFEIVFKSSGVLPVVLTDVQAIETNKDVLVTWNTSTEADMDYYTVEHSRNGTEFSKGYKESALNTSPAKYEWLHKNPGIGVHFYRIRATDLDGKHLLSRVVKVDIGAQKTDLIVYPTVLQTNSVSLQMNAMKSGDYNIQVTDMAGRVIQARKMVIANGSATMLMELPATLSAGKYNVIVTGPEGKFVKPFMKQ